MNRTILAKVAATLTLGAAVIAPLTFAAGASGPARADLRGKILLQVQDKGQAWYVDPASGERNYLGRPADAFAVMRSKGVGISNADIWKLQIGFTAMGGTDTDGDGLTDAFETAIGTSLTKVDHDGDGFSDKDEVVGGFNPYSATDKNQTGNRTFAKANAGRIFLQVEGKGEAWWVNPADLKRYFLGRPADALGVMRAFGLGITNADLEAITAATVASQDVGMHPDTSAPKPPGPTESFVRTSEGLMIESVATPKDAEGHFRIWNLFPDNGTYTTLLYSDTVNRQQRLEIATLNGRFVKYSREVNGLADRLFCRYPDLQMQKKPLCFHQQYPITAAEIEALYHTTAPSAATLHTAAGTEVTTRAVTNGTVTCYAKDGVSDCYFDNNAAAKYSHEDDTVRVEATSFSFTKPDAGLFVRPTAYDPWPEGIDDDAPLADGGPTVVGAGYTKRTEYTGMSELGKSVEWEGVFKDQTLDAPVVVTEYVDDLNRRSRTDVHYKDKLVYRYLRVVKTVPADLGGEGEEDDKPAVDMRDEYACTYDAEGKAACEHASSPYHKGGNYAFPSDSGKASEYFEHAKRIVSKTVADYATDCYFNGESTFCYYNDHFTVSMYESFDGELHEVKLFTVGLPAADLFTPPAEFEGRDTAIVY